MNRFNRGFVRVWQGQTVVDYDPAYLEPEFFEPTAVRHAPVLAEETKREQFPSYNEWNL